MSKQEVRITVMKKETEEIQMTLCNEVHTEVIEGLKELINMSKKQVVKTGKDQNEVIDPQVEFSPKISYGLIKNVGRTKKIEKLQKDVIEKITEEFKSEFPEDETRYATDEQYRAGRNYMQRNFISEHKDFKEFLRDTTEQVSYYVIDISETNKTEIDPEEVFDVAKIPAALIGVVFKVE